MTEPLDLHRVSTLLAMAAGIILCERAYSPALAEEFRAAAKAVRDLADGVPIARIGAFTPTEQEAPA